MPKQSFTINRFHGGLNSNANPRSIQVQEVTEAEDIMVDEIGKVRLLGGTSTSSVPAANAAAIEAGYGLFVFSHDREGANLASTDFGGTHTGTDSDTVLTDSAANFTAQLVGATVYNNTDGSSGTVASVGSTTGAPKSSASF